MSTTLHHNESSGGKLEIEIIGPSPLVIDYDLRMYSYETWAAVYKLLQSSENIFPPSALEECNKYLVKAGLEIMVVRQLPGILSIQVSMKLTNV